MSTTQSGGADETATRRSRVIAAGVSGAQGATLLVLGAFSFAMVGAGRADDPSSAALLAGLAVLVGGGLGCASWALWRGARWARSPSLVWQLVMLPVGYGMLDTLRPVGTVLLISAVAAMVSLLALEREVTG